MADPIALVVGGERLVGWLQAEVVQTCEGSLAATTFSMRYAARSSEQAEPIVIEEGDAITVQVGDEVLVQGYVTRPRIGYDATQVRYEVSGSSRIIDALECSATPRSRRFRDVTLFRLAQQLLEGYEITIQDAVVDDTPIASFSIQEGETIGEALQRAARLRAAVLQDVAGDLVITRAGQRTTATVLRRGDNVLSGERVQDGSARFAEYRFRGQTRATDEQHGLTASQVGGTVVDRGVRRRRVLVVHAHTDRREDIGRRAILERNLRAGRAERLVYEVSGWTNAEGLWRPNVRVRVVDDWLRVDAELLITRVRHVFSLDRWRTTLELTRPEAFSELDYPLRPRGGRWR